VINCKLYNREEVNWHFIRVRWARYMAQKKIVGWTKATLLFFFRHLK